MKPVKPALVSLTATCLLAATIDFAAEGRLWWAHVQFLADDAMEGRATGTAAYHKAAEYVAGQFERQGLAPAGSVGYLQPVRFETRQLVEERSSLVLVRAGQEEPLALGQDATVTPRPGTLTSLEASMVFVGYGLVIPEALYDDLAGMDLRGKIAVYINAPGPAGAPAAVKAHYSSAAERWAALRRAGAVGIASIPNPQTTSGGEGRPAQPAFTLADPSLNEAVGQSVSISVHAAGAEKFFAGSGHTFEEVRKLAAANQPLPRFPLAAELRMQAEIRRGAVEAPNVVGLLRGEDRRLRDDYVILSAHLDHLGLGRPVNGDDLYNGAMDDASGVATVIEVARLLKQSRAHPKRSILFVAFTAEEKGTLGSRYFAAYPTVPAGRIVADINLDMFLPLYPLRFLEVQGLGESTLGDTVRIAAEELGVSVQEDNEPEQNRFIRSDQYSFIRRGIPALAFKFGYAAGSPEEKIRKDWIRERYHRPSDDLAQAVDIAAAGKFDRIILNLIERLANDPARPRWRPDSFFRRFEGGGARAASTHRDVALDGL